MSTPDAVPQLQMVRPTLARVPELCVPANLAVATLEPGWGQHWTRIIAASFDGSEDKYGFDDLMRRDRAFSARRIFFIVDNGVPVATASAWHHSQGRMDTGIIHYVGVLPSHQGRRLGYHVCLAALHHMLKEHRRRATLLTDDFRLPAIHTYLKLGFQPELGHPSFPARWRQIQQHLRQPELLAPYLG